jgi:biotin-(acetyl-CoA carboxylase) ligase
MFRDCRFPPLYRLTTLGADADVAAEARRMAAAGADPATLLCAGRDDRLDCAVILHPERSAADARLSLYIAMLGLGDALGATVPAGVDVTYLWPNRIEANIGAVAEVGIDLPAAADSGAVAEWMTVHAIVVIGALEGEGLHHGFPETSLRDEGCAEVTPAILLEAFARHFLVWVNRWQDDGFEPVRAMWLRHARYHGKTMSCTELGADVTGVFEGIDDDGALLLGQDDATRRITLAAALPAVPC